MITEVVPAEVRGISFSVTGFLGAVVGRRVAARSSASSPTSSTFTVDGEVKGNLANAFLFVTPLVFVGALVVLRGRRHVAGDIAGASGQALGGAVAPAGA